MKEFHTKTYYVDTNILLDNPDAVEILSDNKQNVINIHTQIIDELDRLKRDPKLNHIVTQVTKNLLNQTELFNIVGEASSGYTDDKLLIYIKNDKAENKVLITSDKIFKLKAIKAGVDCEDFKRAFPFIDVTNGDYSGLVNKDTEDLITNCFYLEENRFVFNKPEEPKEVDLNREVWDVAARDIYQSAFFELGLDKDIDIFSVQGPAGTGKTFLSLAIAFYLVFEKKLYSKIYITKAMLEIGQKMGYLPGDVDEKMAPYMEYIFSLIEKLTKTRRVSKLFSDEEKCTFNPRKFQVLPINYIRGRDLEDAVIILDEVQNLSRDETRTVLSRMGRNIKCICIGDKSQIDSPYLNSHNNGLNWILRKFKGEPNYAHLTMSSDFYRGPICELVVKTKL